jgi:hypothetical protein
VCFWRLVAMSALLAASPLLAGVGGRYFEDCAGFGGGVAPYALDPGNAERLWELACRLAF